MWFCICVIYAICSHHIIMYVLSFCLVVQTYGTTPTKDEMMQSSNSCPICQETFEQPVMLKCRVSPHPTIIYLQFYAVVKTRNMWNSTTESATTCNTMARRLKQVSSKYHCHKLHSLSPFFLLSTYSARTVCCSGSTDRAPVLCAEPP